MTKLRKRPVIVEGCRWTGDNLDEVRAFIRRFAEPGPEVVFVQMLDEDKGIIEVYDFLHETWVKCMEGQWVIRGVEGEFYPCDHSVIEQTYDILDDE